MIASNLGLPTNGRVYAPIEKLLFPPILCMIRAGNRPSESNVGSIPAHTRQNQTCVQRIL
jgi:hypothetical protein